MHSSDGGLAGQRKVLGGAPVPEDATPHLAHIPPVLRPEKADQLLFLGPGGGDVERKNKKEGGRVCVCLCVAPEKKEEG